MAASDLWPCLNSTSPSASSDFSNCSFHEHHQESPSPYSFAWKLFFFLLVSIISCVGNSLIIYVLFKFPKIRTAANIIIGGIAICDFFRCPIFAASMLGRARSHNYLMGEVWCRNENFFKLSLNTIVRLSIIAMVAQRLGNVFCRRFTGHVSLRTSFLILVPIWLTAWLSMFALTRTYWVWHRKFIEWKDFHEIRCEVDDRMGKDFWITYVFTFLYIPLFMLLAMYTTVWYLSWRYGRDTRDPCSDGHQLRNSIILVYVLVAILSEVPSQTYIIKKFVLNAGAHPKGREELRLFQLLNHMFKCMDCCLNPIIFGFANMTFRKALLSIWKKNGRQQRLPRPQHEQQMMPLSVS